MQKQSKDSVQQYHKFLLKRGENNPIKRKKKKNSWYLVNLGFKTRLSQIQIPGRKKNLYYIGN